MSNVTVAVRTQLMIGDDHGNPAHLLLAENLLSLLNTSLNTSRSDVTETLDVTTTRVYELHVPKYPQATLVTLCVLLGCMIVATVLGNVFVITAILVERSLQGVSNYLVLSLAVTDLLVAVLVMPLSLLNEVSVHWYLGRALCDMWVSMDVLCCTASILHLVAIAVDRFWAVSNIDYVRRRCARQILLMIAIVWLVSVAISIPPLFGWRHETDNPELSGVCMISQDHGYTIFSTVGAFYCPLVLMLVLNFKIYRAARYRIRRKGFMQGARGHHGHGRGVHIPVPVVHVEQETTAQVTNRNSSGSDASNDGISMYNPSCVVNHELSRADTGLDSNTGDYDQRCSYYPGESTSDSYPYDSYYPVATDDPDPEPLPTFPSFTLSAASSGSPVEDEERLCVEPTPSCSTSQLRPSHRTLSSNHLTVPDLNHLTVPDPHLLFVPSPHHLAAPSPHLLTVPVPHHMTVPSPHLSPSHSNHLAVPSTSRLSVPDAIDLSDSESNHIDIAEADNLVVQDSHHLAGPGSPSASILDLSRRSSYELDLEDKRHLAVPESTEIEDPEPEEIIVPVCDPPATTDSKLVQFNSRVKVEGDTDASETSNSLKPGEDECLPADTQYLEDTDTSQDRRDSLEESVTICCANKILSLELSCVSSSQQEKEESSQQQKVTVQSPPPVLEVPIVTIRKDSCSQYMSESRCLTPAFHSSSSPSTTTTNTSGTSSSQGNQLAVPSLSPIPPTPQPSRSRGNNNTKRARNREKEKQRREKLEMRRERKAARVLGIITGAFVLCWLPFFIMALLVPFLPTHCYVPPVLVSLFLWLGYFNSLLNPIIYTVFNPSFRTAFRKIFFKRLRSVTRS